MKKFDNLSKMHIFFVGIGGISMSGLAKLILSFGAKVTGSDLAHSKEIDTLKSLGVKIFSAHNESNISENIDLVVYSGAIHDSNPELQKARNLNIATMERSQFLGEISRMYEKVIAVSGTHGKTTTTAMLGHIFSFANKKPTIHLGGESIDLGGNTIIGEKDYFIVEACEYRNSFKFLHPDIGVITNIEKDHLDYYKDLNEINKCFHHFARNSKKIVIDKKLSINKKSKISIGSDWEARDMFFNNLGFDYNVYYLGKYFCSIRLNMLGRHNILNSLFAIAVAHEEGISTDNISNALSQFHGVERRYESIGSLEGTQVIIDYAHHPTEIKNSVIGLQDAYPNILTVFQPHTYSRTLSLMKEFVEILDPIENLILYKTYPAREEEIVGGRAEDLCVNLHGKDCVLDFDKLIEKIKEMLKNNNFDAVLVLGAGDLAENLRNYFSKNY